jgi:hypothetical protein
MGAGAFHVRVRDGIGCRFPAIATRSSNPLISRRPLWGYRSVCGSWFWCLFVYVLSKSRLGSCLNGRLDVLAV